MPNIFYGHVYALNVMMIIIIIIITTTTTIITGLVAPSVEQW